MYQLIKQQINTKGTLIKGLTLSLLICLCTSCGNYNLIFNDRTLYTPDPFYLDFSAADRNLQNCLIQHIEDRKITSARELTQVNCSYAGITNLQGLSHFSRIQSLSLKGNPIGSYEELFQLVNLEFLDLSETGLSCDDLSRIRELPLDQLVSSAECLDN